MDLPVPRYPVLSRRRSTAFAVWTLSIILSVQVAACQGRAAEASSAAKDEDPSTAPGGAIVEVDLEAESMLSQARRLMEAQQHREAVQILYDLLEKHARKLVRLQTRICAPVRSEAEALLANGPEEARAVYRMLAEGQAKTLLAQSQSVLAPQALEAIVARHFLTPQGGPAALRLAGYYLDQQRFGVARRLLRRALDRHELVEPERSEALLRLAFACSRTGDLAGAEAAWATLTREHQGPVPTSWQRIHSALRVPAPTSNAGPSSALATRLAGKNAPALVLRWRKRLRNDLPTPASGYPFSVARFPDAPQSTSERAELWAQHGWHPSVEAAFGRGQAYLSAHPYLNSVDMESGRLTWRSRARKVEGVRARIVTTAAAADGLQARQLVWDFGSELARALVVHGDTVFRIENHMYATMQAPRTLVVQRFQWGKKRVKKTKKTSGQITGNVLAAYEAQGGRALWRLGRDADEASPFHDVRFVGLPALSGHRLLVLLEERDGLALAALDPHRGTQLWRRFLCAYLPQDAPPRYAVGLTVLKDEAYIVAGRGLVIAADALDGRVLWAVTYASQRLRPEALWQLMRQKSKSAEPSMWRENRAFVIDGVVVVLAEDTPKLLGLDRDTGAIRYERACNGFTQAIGSLRRRVFLSGRTAVGCVQGTTGEPVWRLQVPCITGRARLTGKTLLLPTVEGVLVIDAANGRRLRSLRLDAAQGLPSGNVYIRGGDLLVVGPESMSAWTLKQEPPASPPAVDATQN